MERTDWLDEGLDSAQAQFLMVTAITHHRFSSPLWGKGEVRKLQAELPRGDRAGGGGRAQVVGGVGDATARRSPLCREPPPGRALVIQGAGRPLRRSWLGQTGGPRNGHRGA